MSAPDVGGSAFPHGWMGEAGQRGMTLRDYFAAKVISQMLAIAAMSPKAMVEIPDSSLAKRAYAVADAMLEARQA